MADTNSYISSIKVLGKRRFFKDVSLRKKITSLQQTIPTSLDDTDIDVNKIMINKSENPSIVETIEGVERKTPSSDTRTTFDGLYDINDKLLCNWSRLDIDLTQTLSDDSTATNYCYNRPDALCSVIAKSFPTTKTVRVSESRITNASSNDNWKMGCTNITFIVKSVNGTTTTVEDEDGMISMGYTDVNPTY